MRALRLLLLLFVVACAGCYAPTRVAGTDDVELLFETESDPAPARFGEDLRALVLRRFSAAQIGADVTDEGRRLRVVVDGSLASIVEELVTWPGSLLAMDPDPSYALVAPHDIGGLVPREERFPDGVVDHFFEGTHTEVRHAIESWHVDRDHRLVAEPMWETARDADEPRWRMRVVKTLPVGELAEGVLVGRGENGTLRLRAERGTLAESVLHDSKERPRRPVLVRGKTSLGVPELASDAFVVSFGEGIRAYERAQEERLLLTTPQLPAMRRVGLIGLPPNTTLATACYIVPLLLSFAWILFVRRFDRAHPEPIWLVLVTFLAGGVATVPAGLLELALSRISPWLDPRVVTFGGQLFALPLAFVVLTFVVGFVEEGLKMLGAMFAVRRREFDEPVDGMVYGIVSSLGFAAAENFHYFAATRLTAPTVIARTFMSVPAHMFFGAIWGYALGARLVDKKTRLLPWLAVAAAGHGAFDAFLSIDGTALLAVLLNLALATVFITLVQRSLRHGVVEEAMLAIRPEERLLFRVGRPALFAVSSLALHILAFGIFVLGAYHQLSRHRPSLGFVVGSSVMLALLAIAAYGVSATMPLDVAVDDYGVTFAGAGRPWRRIRGFAQHADHILLECDGGAIRLGPAAPDIVKQIAEAIRDHVGGKRHETLESSRTD
jgi:RsiW-degrading membrane proteinase PrsW (M82 family)